MDDSPPTHHPGPRGTTPCHDRRQHRGGTPGLPPTRGVDRPGVERQRDGERVEPEESHHLGELELVVQRRGAEGVRELRRLHPLQPGGSTVLLPCQGLCVPEERGVLPEHLVEGPEGEVRCGDTPCTRPTETLRPPDTPVHRRSSVPPTPHPHSHSDSHSHVPRVFPSFGVVAPNSGTVGT